MFNQKLSLINSTIKNIFLFEKNKKKVFIAHVNRSLSKTDVLVLLEKLFRFKIKSIRSLIVKKIGKKSKKPICYKKVFFNILDNNLNKIKA